jgi:phage antirepressor YoqD-like protein
MAKEIIKFDYNGNQIPFENGSNVMVNLTAMAKAYPDKNLTQIVNSQEIKEYCASLSKLQNYSLADLLQVRRGGDNPGTWAHRLVAIRVAQKLNSDLAVWVDMRIEELLTTGNTSLQPQLPNFNNPAEAARAWADQYEKNQTLALEVQQQQETIELQQQELTQSAPKVSYYDNHLQSVNALTTTQIAKEIGMSAEKLNNKLKELGIQFKQSGQWLLKSPYDKWGMHETRTNIFTSERGNTHTNTYTVWTQRGRRFIIALYENDWSVKKAIKQIKGELNPAA